MEDFGYRNLVVWQKSKTFVREVYALVKLLPPEEKYALGDQIRRAAVSIPSNIAEGNGRASNKDYAHFLSIARGSPFETVNQLEIAADLGYIGVDDRGRLEEVFALGAEVGRMLSAMMKEFGLLCTPTPPTYT